MPETFSHMQRDPWQPSLSSILRSAALLLCSGVPAHSGFAQSAPIVAIPGHGAAIDLLEGSTLNRFDTFIRGRGFNTDPEHVFTVSDGILHVSGHEMGYAVTKQSYTRFYLRAEFRWGNGTFGERVGQARDSGILYCVQGEPKVWPRSVEFQIKEGETGDFWLTDGAALTGSDGKRVTGPPGSALNIGHIGKGPEKNVTGFRNTTGELEKPYGEWNLLELVEDGNVIRQYVNGHLAIVGTDPFPTEGKVLFQSEGAEIYFRNLQLAPLK